MKLKKINILILLIISITTTLSAVTCGIINTDSTSASSAQASKTMIKTNVENIKKIIDKYHNEIVKTDNYTLEELRQNLLQKDLLTKTLNNITKQTKLQKQKNNLLYKKIQKLTIKQKAQADKKLLQPQEN